MDDLSYSISQLSPEQRAQLESRLRKGRSGSAATATTITPREDQTAWPMSAAQMRIWSLSRLRPEDPLYNIQRAWRLQGPVDPSVLQASIAEVIRRHEELRAKFTEVARVPIKEIRPFAGFQLPVEPSTGTDPLGYAKGVVKAEAERVFDLADDFLVRGRLLALAHDDHVLVFTAHHLVCDGWSMDIIERELTVIYADLRDAARLSLTPLPLQYADFALWQDQQRQSAAGQRVLEYWTKQLEGPVAPLKLPRLNRPQASASPTGRTLEVALSSELSSEVQALSRRAKVTPYVTLLTGFQMALHRASGQEDVVLCSPAVGRTQLQAEQLVGYFNNLVVLRGDLSGAPTVHQLLERNRAMLLEAFDHQDTPFQEVAALESVATVPLVRGLFVLQEATQDPLRLPGVEVTPMAAEAETADFELAVFLRELGGRYQAHIRFRRNVLATEDVEELMRRFETVLTDMITEPDRPISDFVPGERGAWFESTAAGEIPDTAGRAGEERPRNLLESQLSEIWEVVFKKGQISGHDDFFDLGGHSLLGAELMDQIERRIVGRPMPLAALFEAPTISGLAELIEAGGWEGAWSSLVPIKPQGSRPPLFFVHAHGGNVIGYRDFGRRLSPAQPLYGLQTPNMEHPDPVTRRLEDMAAHYVAEIRTVQPHGPYLVGGWCLGGDVAFEMAQQLTAAGEQVALVVMIDNPRPDHLDGDVTLSPPRRVINRAATRLAMEWSNLVEAGAGGRWRYSVDRMGRLFRGAVLSGERALTRPGGELPFGLDHSRAFRQQDVAAAHEKAYERWQPTHYPGRVAVFRAERQPIGRAEDQSLGWAPWVGRLECHELPGHRIGLLSEPRVQRVAPIIEQVIEDALDSI